MEDYRHLDVAPWVNWLVKYKMKFLIIPFGMIAILPFALWCGLKTFCNEFKYTVIFTIEDAKELKQWLKGK